MIDTPQIIASSNIYSYRSHSTTATSIIIIDTPQTIASPSNIGYNRGKVVQYKSDICYNTNDRNPCTSANIRAGKFYFPSCSSCCNFIQCGTLYTHTDNTPTPTLIAPTRNSIPPTRNPIPPASFPTPSK
eukprot:329557_1